jgi:glycosyltransferase involved in cell wall biosynthesis
MTQDPRPRRVLIVVENLPVPFDRRAWQQATTLRDAGYLVSIICPTAKGFEERYQELEGIAIHRHPLPLEGNGPAGYLLEYGAALFWQFRLSWRVLRTRGFDVLHACNPPDDIFLVGLFYKVLFRKRFVFDHHDLCPELFLAKFGKKGMLYRLMILLERLTFAVADMTIATNESYKRIAVERGGKRPERVHVVRSGPDLRRMRSAAPNDRWKNGRRFLVGYVGVMGRQEGLDYLLQAAARLVHGRGRQDVQFCLVGGGTERSALEAEAARLGVTDYVTFTGRVADHELMEILSTADVCVNPDVVNEMNDKSTMNKIMEYMALGKPIVQFETTEGRFSARDASLYSRPNDAESLLDDILALLDDPGRRAEMGEFGRRRVETELQWAHEAPKLVRAYDQVFS